MLLVLVVASVMFGFDPPMWVWIAALFGEPAFYLLVGYFNRNPYGM